MKKLLTSVLIISFIFSFDIKPYAISTSAKAAVVVSPNGERIIYAENENERLPMASTTKIMTAVVALENADITQSAVVGSEVLIEGTSAGLKPGDTVTLIDLLYGMMLPSGNDAANAIAVFVGKSIDGFVKLMNQKAKELGLDNTHFDTPSGLDGENHYTSAYDLAKLTSYAVTNQDFRKICSTKEKTLNFSGRKVYVKNHNKLIFEDGYIFGVKTGFTKKSGRCLVTAAEKDGNIIVAVTLNDPDDWKDHRNLIEYGFENLQFCEYVFLPRTYKVPTPYKNEYITAYSNTVKFTYCVGDKITYTVDINEFAYPDKSRNILGRVKFYKNGVYFTEVPIKTEIYEKKSKDNLIIATFVIIFKILFL